MMRTGRVGYPCADAERHTAGSAAALAARCKNLRRGSFILNLPLASDHSGSSKAALFDQLVCAARQRQWEVMPSVLAVFRLMSSSTFVACCTGRSAGLSPL